MPYNEELASRVRLLLIEKEGYDEKKMFGGVCFLLRGNMACGVLRDLLIVRVGPDRFTEALERPHAALFDFTGRPMTGWVQVERAGWREERDLAGWVRQGADYARSLPPK